MVPYSLITSALVRKSVAAAAACAAAAVSFGFMDANPSLFWYHQITTWTMMMSPHRRHFEGKTVWIVGASSGIGEELAYRISPYCQTLILSSRNENALQRVAHTCSNSSSNVILLPLDVTSPASELETIIQQTIPKLDCVIFNAGQGQLSPASETDAATTERMFQVNTLPPIILTQLLLKHKLLSSTKDQKPQIVMTSSVGGRMGVPLSSSYAASKHALHGYASSLQAECSSWLRIDMLCPGPIDTNFFGTTQKKKKSPMKMSLERCVDLMMSHICRRGGGGGEAWIAQQPTLLGMYLQQFAPSLWQFVLNQVGPKRMSLYEQGLDLYDPASWKSRTTKKKEDSNKKE